MAADKRDGRHPRPLLSSMPSTPRLAATAASQSKVSPKAPRLAPTASPSSNSSPAKPLRTSASSSTPRPKPSRERSAPLQSYNSPNVTPRSASRRSRADSVHSTPTKSPEGESRNVRPISMLNLGTGKDGLVRPTEANQKLKYESIRRRSSTSTVNTSAIVSRSPPSSLGLGIAAQAVPHSKAQTTSFFYANDAPLQSTSSPRLGLQKKTSTFFYANGQQEPTLSPAAKSSSVIGSQNGIISASPQGFDSDARSVKSASPEIKSRAFPFAFQPQSPTFFRSPSPPKENIHLSYRKGASQIIRPNIPQSSSQPVLSEPLDEIIPDENRRLSSIDINSGRRAPHKASSSVSASSGLPPLKPPNLDASPVLSPASVVDQDSSERDFISPVTSDSNSQLLKDLAANARRERKLLDLEISNTSLLAINRSLEREVRKQKLDLRRFRRLSRATTSRSSWLSESGSADSLDPFADDLDGPLPDLLEEEEDESDYLSDLESMDEGSMSPTALAESDARHRKSDARRLRLDLAKHKQLLIDSQKMNQSIKRCLGWTEQLIKDGNKALQYQVNVSDLRLGGRVLSPEEVEEGTPSYFPINHESTDEPFNSSWRPLQKTHHAGSDATDKDSGVDVEYTQRTSDSFQRPASNTLVDTVDGIL